MQVCRSCEVFLRHFNVKSWFSHPHREWI
jgi:hypothetical protein